MRNLPNLIKVSLIISLAILFNGCQSAGSPTTPSAPTLHTSGHSIANSSRRQILGFWEIEISSDHTSATAVPLRGAEMHFNMVHILETTCTDCLTIDNVYPLPDGSLNADLTIKHPFPGKPKYTGFDVRGILITGSDYTFPVSGRKIAWNDQNPKLLNADGYTSLFNPTDFPENPGVPFILRYTKGENASDTASLNATLNPYIAYSEDQPRRIFPIGTSQTATAILKLPDGEIKIGYVVDASWFPADGDIIDPIVDFPPDANSLEAYKISVNTDLEVMPYAGSSVPIEVEIWDHQGPATISSVTLESPDLFTGEVALSFGAISPDNTAIYTGLLKNELGAGAGEYPLLVRVADSQTDPNLGAVDAWQVRSVTVIDIVTWNGWARTWGGIGPDAGYSVAVDMEGNVYVTGDFSNTADFDPGPGVDNHTSNGLWDVFLSKFDPSGNFIWAKTWGGSSYDVGYGIAVDSSGNVYVTGYFDETVDFDPAAVGEEIRVSYGALDAFLSKFDSSGNLKWTRTWGGGDNDSGLGVTVDGSGTVYTTGYFCGTVDFDPDIAVDYHISNGTGDAFMTKFDSSGIFQWAKTWGGVEGDLGYGVAVDGSGNVYVTGIFSETVDFDPGPGVDNHITIDDYDIFLSKFDWSGNFLWARTWGGQPQPGDDYDTGRGVAVDGSGNVYVTGWFQTTADFDPGPGEDYHTSSGWWDAFLSRFDSSGNFVWAKTWGAEWGEEGHGVALDESGSIYVAGIFDLTVDFDPGPGVDNHTSSGVEEIFLSRFDSSGNFIWAKTWGGTGNDKGYGVAVDGWENVYVTGYFSETADFNPGPGVDNRTSNGGWDVFLSKFAP